MKKILAIIIDQVLTLPAHQKIKFSESKIPHPEAMGFRRDIGGPAGQSEDYRLALKDGKSVHAQKYDNKWFFHWDKIDPLINGMEHLRVDAQGYYTLATSGIGGGIGAAIGGGLGALSESKDGARDGAVVGGLLGTAIGALFGILTAEWDDDDE